MDLDRLERRTVSLRGIVGLTSEAFDRFFAHVLDSATFREGMFCAYGDSFTTC